MPSRPPAVLAGWRERGGRPERKVATGPLVAGAVALLKNRWKSPP
jgi:hypothetical protein